MNHPSAFMPYVGSRELTGRSKPARFRSAGKLYLHTFRCLLCGRRSRVRSFGKRPHFKLACDGRRP